MPTSTRSALLRLGRPEREATDIDAMCERLKIGDLGRRGRIGDCGQRRSVHLQCQAAGIVHGGRDGQLFSH